MTFRVMCDGAVIDEYDEHEDALDMAAGWNRVYPTPPYPASTLFVVEPAVCGNPDCECAS